MFEQGGAALGGSCLNLSRIVLGSPVPAGIGGDDDDGDGGGGGDVLSDCLALCFPVSRRSVAPGVRRDRRGNLPLLSR